MVDGIRAQGNKMSVKIGREDTAGQPYAVPFEASVLSDKSEKP